jgi:hypothetical protein
MGLDSAAQPDLDLTAASGADVRGRGRWHHTMLDKPQGKLPSVLIGNPDPLDWPSSHWSASVPLECEAVALDTRICAATVA